MSSSTPPPPSARRLALEIPERVQRLVRPEEDNEFELAVLDSIEGLLQRDSLHQISVERILEEAGISRATFYRYFSSKWSVIAAALERAIKELFEAGDRFLEAPDHEDPVAVLHQAMLAEVAVYRRRRHVLRAAMQYWSSTPELRKLWVHFREQQVIVLSAFIEEQRHLGRSVPGPPADQLAQVLVWSSINAFITAAATFDQDDDAEARVVPGLTHIWALAIYGRPFADAANEA